MIPTVHRFSEIPVFENKYYVNALKYCKNENEKERIEKSAAEIEKLRADIQKTVGIQAPYDIFLCYKETKVGGGGFTPEFYWADELYRKLKGEGYRVFFAKESLPAAKGDYEAHIFPALKSARLMLVLTTAVEHVESVWVKNEWSRFIRFSRDNTNKRFKVVTSGFKPETLPRELRKEQVLNHDGMGWVEQLNEILKDSFPKKYKNKDDTKSNERGSNIGTASLLKRVYAFLADGDFESANEYCERVLDIDLENAEAYLGKLMAELKVKTKEELKLCKIPFDNSINCQKLVKFANETLKTEICGYIDTINTRNKKTEDEKKECDSLLKELKIFTKISNLQSEITRLSAEKSRLGLFSGKQKKEIAQKILVLENEIHLIKQTISYSSDSKATDNIRKKLNASEYGRKLLVAHDKQAKRLNANIGDVVKFGKYKQSSADAPLEDIEWQVIDKQDNKALVISKYGLERKKYNETSTVVTWETCTLRKWLNKEFINAAFTDEEQNAISHTTVPADKNPSYKTTPGNTTYDKIFVPSILEVNKYFKSEKKRRCKATAYTLSKGILEDKGDCMWWLRTPGQNQDSVASVSCSGLIIDDGDFVHSEFNAVRPAMWIDLNE